MKEKDIIELARKRFEDSLEADQSERQKAYDDLVFAINDEDAQWSKDIKESREADGRPCLVLNKIPEKIDIIEGEFKQLRPAVKVRAVDSTGDPQTAEIIAGIIRHIEYNSDARRAYNTSHSSVLKCGRGAWRIDIVEADDDPFERDLVINRIPNVFSVYFDPMARKFDKSDSKWVHITEVLKEEEYKHRYPKKPLVDWETVSDKDTNWRTKDTVRISEYWWEEYEDVTFYRVKRMVDVSVETLTVENPSESDQILDTATVKRPKIKWCKMNDSHILEGPNDYPGKYMPIIFEIGREDYVNGHQKTRGMVRYAKDPQRMYNYWSSAVTEMIALAPKSPYLVTGKMISAYQDKWDSANLKNYAYLPIDADPNYQGQWPKRESPPQMSSAMAHELARMDHDIQSSMGLYRASLGDTGGEVSGKAITARKRQGDVGSYTYTDNFEAALIYSNKILVDLIPKVYSSERIVRILGEDGTEKQVAINAREKVMNQAPVQPQMLSKPKPGITEYWNDLSVGKYDVSVSIGPSYTTQRQEAIEMMIELTAKVPQLAGVALDLIVKNLDLPGADELMKRARKIVLTTGLVSPEPGEELPPPQPPDPKVVVDMKKLEQNMMQLQLKAQKERREDFKAEIDAIKKISEAMQNKMETAMTAITGLVDKKQQESQVA